MTEKEKAQEILERYRENLSNTEDASKKWQLVIEHQQAIINLLEQAEEKPLLQEKVVPAEVPGVAVRIGALVEKTRYSMGYFQKLLDQGFQIEELEELQELSEKRQALLPYTVKLSQTYKVLLLAL